MNPEIAAASNADVTPVADAMLGIAADRNFSTYWQGVNQSAS